MLKSIPNFGFVSLKSKRDDLDQDPYFFNTFFLFYKDNEAALKKRS